MSGPKKYYPMPRLENGKWEHGPINFRRAQEEATLAGNLRVVAREAERHEMMRKESERQAKALRAECEVLRSWLARIANPTGGDVGVDPKRLAQAGLSVRIAK
jgi:hypothetical protein